MRLEAVSMKILPGLEQTLLDLGAGENGFGGTVVGRDGAPVEEFLAQCVESADPARVKPGLVAQTTFWLVEDSGEVVGMARMRHCLNDSLKERGGHIGYYVRPDRRGLGYGREALRLTLAELKRLGEPRALLTVSLNNAASVKVIEANGGLLESTGEEGEGRLFGRFWVDLALLGG